MRATYVYISLMLFKTFSIARALTNGTQCAGDVRDGAIVPRERYSGNKHSVHRCNSTYMEGGG